jgi:hypothetical protein
VLDTQPPKVRNKHPTWCGPVAIALLTGCTVNDAAQLYANVHNHWRRPAKHRYRKRSTSIRGVFDGETKWVLDLLGYDIFPIENRQGKTVREFMRSSDLRIISSRILVAVPRHYVVCYRGRVSDNHKFNVPAYEHPMADEFINDAWLVKQKPFGHSDELCAIA